MKLFLDSANLHDIEACLDRGFLSGITTNPSILSKEPKTDFVAHLNRIADLCRRHGQMLPLSVEVFTPHASEMVRQGQELKAAIPYDNLNVKIPIGWGELKAISDLSRQGINVNCTCLFTEAQAVLAANAGARYVSIFLGRLRDVNADPLPVIANTRRLLDRSGSTCEIIVGSIRHERDITDAHLAGAHIVTAGASLLEKMAGHPQTNKSVEGFLHDFEKWLK